MTGVPTFVADVTATDGSKTPVAYQVTDVVGQTASAFLTPVIPGLSTVVADSGSAGLDTNQTFDVVANDVSGSLTVLVHSTVRLCATGQSSPNCTATTLSVSGEGTYSVDSSGIVTFDPDPLFVGQATPISYQVNDLMDRSFSTTITPTVTSVPPTATPDTIVIVAGGSRSFDPIFGAGGLVTRNVGGTALDPTTVCIVDPVTTICGVSSVVAVGEGTYSLDVNTGVVTFTAEAGVRPGQLTPLVYKMSDLSGHVVESTLTPTILGPLVLHADASADVQSAVQILRPLVNDDPGSLNFPLVPSTLRLCAPTDTPPVCSQTTLQVEGEGTYVVNTATGEITFTPLENFTGSATPISYVVEDSYGQRQSSEIAVVVRASSSSVPGGSASGSGNNQSGNSSQPTNSEGGKIPTTGRNTSELVGLLLVVVALGIVFSRAARRRNYSC
jgi:CshA-type fibril repeat protein